MSKIQPISSNQNGPLLMIEEVEIKQLKFAPRRVRRRGKKLMKKLRASIQQAPVPEAGNYVKSVWLQVYDVRPTKDAGDRIVLSWDTAFKSDQINDYSVCTVWHVKSDKRYFLLDVIREKMDFPTLLSMAQRTWQHYAGDYMIVEDKGSGTSLIQTLRAQGIHSTPYQPKGDKIMRFYAQVNAIERGQVYLPKEALWLADFRTEILAFPTSRNDDQIDSVSQFLDWSENHTPFAVDWGHPTPGDDIQQAHLWDPMIHRV